MTKLINLKKGLLGTVAVAVLSAGTAFADGTAAGTPVNNTFTLNYEVNGAGQPVITNAGTPTTFLVDRVVDLTVTNTSGQVSVAPGQENVSTVFTLSNDGNGTQAYDLDLFTAGGLGSVIGATTGPDDDFDPLAPSNGIVISYVPVGGGAAVTFDPADTSTYPVLDADDSITITVTQNIPTLADNTAVVDDALANVVLVANTLNEPGVASPLVAFADVTADSNGNDLLASENILIDADGPAAQTVDGVTPDGAHSAIGTYIVASADVTGEKTVSVITQNGTNCTDFSAAPNSNAYSIPGACVEYRITVTNNDTRAATAIAISDTLPAELNFVAAQVETSGDFTGGVLTVPTITPPATSLDCTGNACVVSFTGATLPADDGVTPDNNNSPEGVIVIRALLK